MAKKTTLNTNALGSTIRASLTAETGEDPILPVGSSLRTSEVEYLKAYAEEHHASFGSLLAALLRHASQDLINGTFEPEAKGLKFLSTPFDPPTR